ncbi:uncharacterized protein [Diadema setosum]|uniref:uncharacterized protein n=1 Tax=Diadema setosum TaxID=31175 RepID=UPI003B3AFF82
MAANQNRQRRPYNRVSNQDRNRIIDAFLGEDLDYLEVAQTLGVNRQTARSIVTFRRCIYTDECGFNTWTRRSYGRAARGEPVRRVVNNQRGANCNVTFAISNQVGLHGPPFRSAGPPFRSAGDDDAGKFPAIHRHVNAQVPDAFENIVIRSTSPYSPFLNPVEMAHSAFKAAVRRTLSLPEWQARIGDRAAAREAGVILQGWRARCLELVAEANVNAIAADKCARWYNHAQTYLARCLARQETEG